MGDAGRAGIRLRGNRDEIGTACDQSQLTGTMLLQSASAIVLKSERGR